VHESGGHARPPRPPPEPWIYRYSFRPHRFRRLVRSPATLLGSPEPSRGECDAPRSRRSRRSRDPEHVADLTSRSRAGVRRSPISPGTKAAMVCACHETACPMSGSSGGRSRRIRKAYPRARTTRGYCRSDNSAAVRSAAHGKVRATGLFRSEPFLKLKQRLRKTAPKRLVMRLSHLDISLISRKQSYVTGLKRRGMTSKPVSLTDSATAGGILTA
jgi:hypothetical protein